MKFTLCLILFLLVEADELACHFCRHSKRMKDVSLGENQTPDCMNKLRMDSRNDLRRICTPLEPFCASTVTNLNGFFIMIVRDCAEVCVPSCEARGYGLFWSECTRCCNSSYCNEWDGKDYYLPNGRSNMLIFTALAHCNIMILMMY